MFKAYLTEDYYIRHEVGGTFVCDWASNKDVFGENTLVVSPSTKKIATGKTLEECKTNALKECEGSRWAMYPSMFIEDEEGSWVWECITELVKCPQCQKEEWSTVSSYL